MRNKSGVTKRDESERHFTPLKDKMNKSFYDDDNPSEDEGMPGYKKGKGYHPVHVGEVLGDDRYVIIKKLGWGHFSTVWLALDRTKTETTYVAMKVQKSGKNNTEVAKDEVKLLSDVAKYWHENDWETSINGYYVKDK